MTLRAINPATGERVAELPVWTAAQLETALQQVAAATSAWMERPVVERSTYLSKVAQILRRDSEALARLITLEMGKLIGEARAEIEKCAWGCDFYAEQGRRFIADEEIASDAGKSYVAYQPLGTVLAVMPWNFPFWQVFRFAAPALVAGNTAVLKHASNVPQCALAIEQVISEAGVPAGVFRSLMIASDQVADIIADRRIHAVTLTGSTAAGRKVAAAAGQALKKSVMELGGSDAFIVLADADLTETVPLAVRARFQNAGQSCIAAKRFIVMENIADEFAARFKAAIMNLRHGDPLHESSSLAPLARGDLRDEVHRQVTESMAQGAVLLAGGKAVAGQGYYYEATLLDHVRPGMPLYEEEIFGPVAGIIRVRDEDEALAVANNSCYGLGGSVWTRDRARGERLARRLQAGACFVNGMVKSDPRLPFGGIKESGYGRELSYHGLREFVNVKTIWMK